MKRRPKALARRLAAYYCGESKVYPGDRAIEAYVTLAMDEGYMYVVERY